MHVERRKNLFPIRLQVAVQSETLLNATRPFD